MLKLAIISVSLPLLAIFLLKKFALDPIRSASRVSTNVRSEALYQFLLGNQVNIMTGETLRIRDNTLELPKSVASAQDIGTLSEASIQSGLIIASQFRDKWITNSRSIILSSKIITPLTILVSSLGVLSGTIPLRIGLSLILFSYTYVTLSLLYLCAIRFNAAKITQEKAEQFMAKKEKKTLKTFSRSLQCSPFNILENFPFHRKS